MKIYQVDAFTKTPFKGNPAAVMPMEAFLPDALMQDIAMENNLAETAYCVPRAEPHHYDLRWFTPGMEIDFCGHATIATVLILGTGADVRSADPDMSLIGPLGEVGVIITAKGESGYDCVSRYFAPNAGIDEDPVTGSAHAAIGPYWAERLGKTELTAFQASARGGVLYLDVGETRLTISGHAVTFMRGEVLI